MALDKQVLSDAMVEQMKKFMVIPKEVNVKTALTPLADALSTAIIEHINANLKISPDTGQVV